MAGARSENRTSASSDRSAPAGCLLPAVVRGLSGNCLLSVRVKTCPLTWRLRTTGMSHFLPFAMHGERLNEWQVMTAAIQDWDVRHVSEFGHGIEFVRTYRYCLSLELI